MAQSIKSSSENGKSGGSGEFLFLTLLTKTQIHMDEKEEGGETGLVWDRLGLTVTKLGVPENTLVITLTTPSSNGT